MAGGSSSRVKRWSCSRREMGQAMLLNLVLGALLGQVLQMVLSLSLPLPQPRYKGRLQLETSVNKLCISGATSGWTCREARWSGGSSIPSGIIPHPAKRLHCLNRQPCHPTVSTVGSACLKWLQQVYGIRQSFQKLSSSAS